MPRIILRPTFAKDLDGLRTSSRKHYQRASEVLLELQRDQTPSASRRSESRIPDCVKFELPDGYRLVLQRAEGDGALVALAVGTHDRIESFLDGHKGYVFDSKSGRVRELRLASSAEATIDIAPSPGLSPQAGTEPAATAVFDVLSDEHLGRLGVPIHLFERLRNIIDANSLDCMTLLQELADAAPNAAGALLSFATGNSATRQTVLDIGAGEAVLLQKFPAAAVEKPDASSEEFITFSDPDGLAHVLEQGTLQQWQLFLHPDQRQLVGRSFSGPARLRGISGSGKTVVALHRVRRLARDPCAPGFPWTLDCERVLAGGVTEMGKPDQGQRRRRREPGAATGDAAGNSPLGDGSSARRKREHGAAPASRILSPCRGSFTAARASQWR